MGLYAMTTAYQVSSSACVHAPVCEVGDRVGDAPMISCPILGRDVGAGRAASRPVG
jgi:hypothetical protein